MGREPGAAPPGRHPLLPRARRVPRELTTRPGGGTLLLCALSLGGAVAAGALLASPRPPALALQVREFDGGRVLLTRRLSPGQPLALRFTHSMYGGDVEEQFTLAGDAATTPHLRRERVWAAHSGAAEYYARYGNVREVPDGWLVDVPPLQLERLPVRVDRTGSPRLLLGNDEVALLDLVADGQTVLLAAVTD